MQAQKTARRSILKGLLAAAAVPGAARAQSANRPLRIVVPYPPGGTQDAMMRVIQEPLGRLLGQPIVVENRAGAAGMIGSHEVRQASADGNTLLLFNNGMVITPLVQRGASIDFAKDFASVTTLAEAPLVIFGHASLPANDIRELIALAKAKPRTLNFGSTGLGGLGHLTMAAFERKAGIELSHVPYKGNAPLMLALIGGEVPLAIGTVSDATLQSMQAGRIKALAVTSRAASQALPGIAPISDTVGPFGISATYAFLAPSATSADAVQRLREAIVKVMDLPDIRQRYLSYGNVVRTSTPKELNDLILNEASEWKSVIQSAGIRVE